MYRSESESCSVVSFSLFCFLLFNFLLFHFFFMSFSLQPHGLRSLPGSSVHGIFQARILELAVISFSMGFEPRSPALQVSFMIDKWVFKMFLQIYLDFCFDYPLVFHWNSVLKVIYDFQKSPDLIALPWSLCWHWWSFSFFFYFNWGTVYVQYYMFQVYNTVHSI